MPPPVRTATRARTTIPAPRSNVVALSPPVTGQQSWGAPSPQWGGSWGGGCTCGCGGGPGCSCGGDWGSGGCGDDIIDCWGKITALKAIIAEIIGDMGGPVKTGPIIGVVDGSDARPGEVGEYIHFEAQTSYPIGPFNAINSVGVLPAGDWDLRGSIWVSTSISYLYTVLNPVPAGFSTNMSTGTGIYSSTGAPAENVVMTAFLACRAGLSVPTLMPFLLNVDGVVAGTANWDISARRIR